MLTDSFITSSSVFKFSSNDTHTDLTLLLKLSLIPSNKVLIYLPFLLKLLLIAHFIEDLIGLIFMLKLLFFFF